MRLIPLLLLLVSCNPTQGLSPAKSYSLASVNGLSSDVLNKTWKGTKEVCEFSGVCQNYDIQIVLTNSSLSLKYLTLGTTTVLKTYKTVIYPVNSFSYSYDQAQTDLAKLTLNGTHLRLCEDSGCYDLYDDGR